MSLTVSKGFLLMAVMLLLRVPDRAWPETAYDSNPIGNPRIRTGDAEQSETPVAAACPDAEGDCCALLSGTIAATPLSDLLRAAGKCINTDTFNPCDGPAREIHDRYLHAWEEKLEPRLAMGEANPLEKLEIRKALAEIAGRRREIAGLGRADCLETACDDCDSNAQCRKRCRQNHAIMEAWRSRYKTEIKGNQYLSCETCVTALETYYEDQKTLFAENRLNVEKLYTKEHLDVMWGLLFCLSRSADASGNNNNNCLERAQRILPHAMLPFVLPPSELLQLLADKFKQEGGLTDEEAGKIIARHEQSIHLITVLVALLEKSGKVPDIPPSDLAALLLNLIANNQTSLGKLTIKERLDLFSATFGALSEEDLRRFSIQNPEYKEILAKFFVAAIHKADKATLEMLASVGFSDDDLTRLIVALYEKDGAGRKKSFIHKLIKIFDEETIIINEIVSERFFEMGNEEQQRILKNDNYQIQIERFAANLRAARPDLVAGAGSSASEAELHYAYVKSFLMPGYPISFYEPEAGAWVQAWNYSNYVLLGVSLASQMLFINSEYEEKDYYRVGVAGTYLFALNGLAGAVQAYMYRPPGARRTAKIDWRLSIAGNRLAVMCRIHL